MKTTKFIDAVCRIIGVKNVSDRGMFNSFEKRTMNFCIKMAGIFYRTGNLPSYLIVMAVGGFHDFLLLLKGKKLYSNPATGHGKVYKFKIDMKEESMDIWTLEGLK